MPSNNLILCHRLLLLPSIFPRIRVFSNESALHIRWPKYWSFISTSVLPMNIQDWFPLGWTGWISLQPKGLSRVFSNTTVQKHQFSNTTVQKHQFFYNFLKFILTLSFQRVDFLNVHNVLFHSTNTEYSLCANLLNELPACTNLFCSQPFLEYKLPERL